MIIEPTREEHIHAATVLRRDAAQTLDRLDGDHVEWLQAGAMEAQARALLATSHEAAASRLDAETFRRELGTTLPSGWQLPAEAVSTGKDLLSKLRPVCEALAKAWVEGDGVWHFDEDDIFPIEATRQFLSRLLSEIESKGLVEKDPASS